MMRREEEGVDALLEWAVSSLIQIRISKLKTSMSTIKRPLFSKIKMSPRNSFIHEKYKYLSKVPNVKFFVYKKSFNRLINESGIEITQGSFTCTATITLCQFCLLLEFPV